MSERLGFESRRLRLMRLALTRATAKWGTGGRLKTRGAPRPVTLAGEAPDEKAAKLDAPNRESCHRPRQGD